jgi:hypothetical protein
MADERVIQSTESPLNKTFADKFYFIFELPEALKNLTTDKTIIKAGLGVNKKALQWSIVKAEVPNINIKANAINYAGGSLHLSTHTKSPYDPFKLTFKVDSNWLNYFTIYEWINFIYGEKEGHYDEEGLSETTKFSEYAIPVSIVGMDEYNNPKIQWIFTYAFPTDISSISLDYTSTDEIEFTVTFVFSQMHIRNILYDNIKNNPSL